jgi:hypothetical protein
MEGLGLKRKLFFTFILFVSIICLAGCAGCSISSTSQTTTEVAVTTIPVPELKSAEIEGSDGSKSYKLENNIINGNINAISVKMQILNLADNKIEVVWSANNKEIFRNGGVDHLTGDYYSAGITLSEGFIAGGNYSCEIFINNNSLKIIKFEIKQLN